MPIDDDLFEKLKVELRRGALGLAVLAALREERYGYTLRQMLDDVFYVLAQVVPHSACALAVTMLRGLRRGACS